MTAADTCGTCAAYAKSWPSGERAVTCGECGAVLTRERTGYRNARADMALLANWRRTMLGHASDPCPQVVGDGNTGGGKAYSMSGRPDRVDEHNHELRRALAADARLTEMRARPGEGRRYAEVVWFAYGHRGDEVNMRESCAKATAIRFAEPEQTETREGKSVVTRASELSRWRDADSRREGLTGETALIAFGNDLIGAAVDAYERDRWREMVVVVSKRAVFVQGIADRWGEIRERVLAKATKR
jgi:hypothetical protein